MKKFLLFLTLKVFFLTFSAISVDFSGKRGIAVTRWSSNTLKSFEVEFIGTVKSSPKSYVIIAKTKDEEISKTGVAAGMSGSPVYVDGKIIGAVAFTWSFLKEPIFGITPIEDMLELQKYIDKVTSKPEDLTYSMPIFLSGVSEEVKEFLKGQFKVKNLLFIDNFSKVIPENVNENTKLTNNIEPGDALGIILVSGDIEISAIGTVTYVEGNKIFALGHPAFLGGNYEIPISRAEVLSVIPRQNLSFKLAVPGEIVGSMKFDGNSGIFAELGKIPKMIDVSVAVDGKYLYKYQIANVPELLPGLISAVLQESILKSQGRFGENNIELYTRIGFRFENIDREFDLEFRDIIPTFVSEYGYLVSIDSVSQLANFILRNPLLKANINSISTSIKTKPVDIDFITSLIVSKQKVSPGDKIKVTVVMKKFRGEFSFSEFTFNIPIWVKKGTRITFSAMNMATRTIYEMSKYPEMFSFNTYEDLRRFISEDLRVDKLSVNMEIPNSSVAMGGIRFDVLPDFLNNAIFSIGRSKNVVPFTISQTEMIYSAISGTSFVQVVVE